MAGDITTVIVDAAASGKLDKLSYGQLVSGAVKTVTTNEKLMSELSPPGRLVAGIMSATIDAAIQGELTPDKILDAAKATLLNATVDLSRTVLKEVLVDAALSITKDASSVIPVLGALVNMAIDIVTGIGSARGVGASSSDVNERRAFCISRYAPVIGTGPGMQVLPSDFFSLDGSKNGGGQTWRSSVGDALISINEYSLYDSNFSLLAVKNMAIAYKAMGRKNMVWALDQKLGVPMETQAIFMTLRLAMEKTWKCGDGGVSIWPLYLDLMRAQWDKGTMNSTFAKYLCVKDSWPIHPEVAQDGESTCFFHDNRAYQQAMNLVRGWKQTVKPYYAQFASDIQFNESSLLDAAKNAAEGRLGKASIISSNQIEILKHAALLRRVNKSSNAPPSDNSLSKSIVSWAVKPRD